MSCKSTQPPGSRAGNFSDSSFNIAQSFRCLGLASVRMYESGEELLHPEEIQSRFEKVFGREMTQAERDIFFLPVEPSSAQKDNG
jgi:hypothetical protein